MSARRHAPVAVLAVAALATALAPSQRTMPLRRPLASLPAAVAGYTGQDDTLATSELAVTRFPEYLMRTYRRGDSVGFTAFVGYWAAHDGREGYHSPQACLPAAGWEPLATSRLRAATPRGEVEVNRYLVGRGAQRALVLYWFQGRGRLTAGEYATKLHLLGDALRYRRNDEAFVRLVIPMPDVRPGVMGETPLSDAEAADALARTALAALVPALDEVLPAPDA